MFFSRAHIFYTELVEVFTPGSHSSGIKGGVGSILVKLEKLWEQLVGAKNSSRMAR